VKEGVWKDDHQGLAEGGGRVGNRGGGGTAGGGEVAGERWGRN